VEPTSFCFPPLQGDQPNNQTASPICLAGHENVRLHVALTGSCPCLDYIIAADDVDGVVFGQVVDDFK
jgi:hypothetical protein